MNEEKQGAGLVYKDVLEVAGLEVEGNGERAAGLARLLRLLREFPEDEFALLAIRDEAAPRD